MALPTRHVTSTQLVGECGRQLAASLVQLLADSRWPICAKALDSMLRHVALLTARINHMSDTASCRQPRVFTTVVSRASAKVAAAAPHLQQVFNRHFWQSVGFMVPGKISRCCRRAHASKLQSHERNTKPFLARGRGRRNSLRLQARFARVNPASVALRDVDTEKLGCAKPALSGFGSTGLLAAAL